MSMGDLGIPRAQGQSKEFDVTGTRLLCFSGAEFSEDLRRAEREGEVELVGLDELYGRS
ncbi:hypothetical protein LTT66_15395 [Nocardia gipuzkoensis]|uniref:hypothetical protein n=1 Tax=Nocardia gipuzkoensis TaxID=2749991 RepID=UPI001E31C24F|nr:hypothetical protein [Nocardia gipuzkoensis]UGT71400.1 hypothetical protein LTT66_15395 [Nocardia gipuzkoensis]